MKNQINNLDDFLQSDYYLTLESDYYLNLQHWYLEDEDRANRMEKASHDGNFGLTHAERLEDMRDAVLMAYQDNRITSEQEEKLMDEIDSIWTWHKNNNSLDEET